MVNWPRSAWILAAAVAVGMVLVWPARGMVDCERVSCPRAQKTYLVAAIGDSLTDERVGGGQYVAQLRRRCPGSRFDAYGVGGQRTNHMRWRFRRDVFGLGVRAKSKPAYTHVIVLGGINDLAAQSMYTADVRGIQDNLATMYRQARSRGVAVVALTLPPWGYVPGGYDRRPAATRRVNAWIRKQGREGLVDRVVDIYPLLSCGDVDTLCPRFRRWPKDEIHWNSAGHAIVSERLHRDVFGDCR